VIKLFSIYLLVLFIALTSCDSSKNSGAKTFTNIDSALNYCKETNEYKSLLFALVTKDVSKNQSLGWNILGDKEIIATAKRDYVLIITDPNKIFLSKDSDTKEFQDILKMDKDEPYFVVTNHVFYPFRQFTLKTDKETIIDQLKIGEGP